MPANDLLLDVLKRFAATLAGSFDVSEVLYDLNDRVVEILGADGAGVSLGDDHDMLRFVAANNEASAAMETAQQDSQQGPCHDAYQTLTPVLVTDLADHADWSVFRAQAHQIGYQSVAGIPMALNGKRFGVINVYSCDVRTWTDDDIAAALTLADMATSYVVHSSEIENVRRVNEQLQTALDSRIIIEQAKGLLAGERAIPIDAAFALLRDHARANSATLRSVAEAVVNLGLRPHPEHPR